MWYISDVSDVSDVSDRHPGRGVMRGMGRAHFVPGRDAEKAAESGAEFIAEDGGERTKHEALQETAESNQHPGADRKIMFLCSMSRT